MKSIEDMSVPSMLEFLGAVLINTRNIGLYVHLVWMAFILVKAGGIYHIFFALVSSAVTISVFVFINERDNDNNNRSQTSDISSKYKSFILKK